MATKIKNKPLRYYIFSELLDSSEIPSDMKENLEREVATYRRAVPTKLLPQINQRKVNEIVTSNKKVMFTNKDGEQEEGELEISSFDLKSWRYYLEPKTLSDFETFVDELGLEVSCQTFDPQNSDHDGLEEWLEAKIGLPLPTSKIMVVEVLDFDLLGESCECDECRNERGAKDEEND